MNILPINLRISATFVQVLILSLTASYMNCINVLQCRELISAKKLQIVFYNLKKVKKLSPVKNINDYFVYIIIFVLSLHRMGTLLVLSE